MIVDVNALKGRSLIHEAPVFFCLKISKHVQQFFTAMYKSDNQAVMITLVLG